MSWNPFHREARKEKRILPSKLEALEPVAQRAAALPPTLQVPASFAIGILSMWGASLAYRRYFKRIRNVEWITPDFYKRKRWLKGRVASVGDADNFRMYHTPGIGWNWPFRFRTIPTTPKDLKDNTIHIRMAGVDAPEGAHFGRPAQDYYAESLDWLTTHILGKTVYIQVLRRDQYSRVVAMPYLKPRFLPGSLFKGKCVSLEMLKAGWVLTYEQAGAEYGEFPKEHYQTLEQGARAAKRGIWKGGALKETPAEYKRKYAKDADVAERAGPSSAAASDKDQGILKGLKKFLNPNTK